MPLTLTFSPNWVELSLNSVRQARCACVCVCVVCAWCVVCVCVFVCMFSVECCSINVALCFCFCYLFANLITLPPFGEHNRDTHTQHTHTAHTYTQHCKMAPRAFRARLNTLTAVGPARRLPRRGINMLHKYKHKSINNFDEQRVTLALHTFWPLACGTCSSSSDSKSTICDSCCGRNCALPTFRCSPQMPGSAAGAVWVRATLLIKFECAQLKTNTQYRRVCVCHMCVSACTCVWLCLLCDTCN